ncbi:MAG: iron chelate uptake ABC transporter family permease subunit [Firmicutes bacterium]|uniref:Iron chelate uptake ABC transporter family permease subunit n=1 Tax=Candidatus Scybalomonas excrementavium TaxID=2840943 RepID=A0A9D9HYK8_9FIRM|nr:iron chelate uptake ABC transporter family permease subunit [Candidatus Scybalomonas excrementavium]
MRTHKKVSYKKIVGILCLIAIASILLFIGWGLTKENMGFFLPRRWKKIGAIVLTSYCIAYSSITFQTVTNNRILTPSVMGLDSLYLFIQTLIVFFFGSKQLIMLTGMKNFFLSIGFMLLLSFGLFFLLFWKEGKSIYFLVLAGMIVGGFFSGLSTFMQVLLDPNEFLILQGKMFAGFDKINESLFGISVLLVIISIFVTWKDYASLDAMSLGQDHAINLGIPYRKMLFKNLMNTSVLIAVSTALTGPITFLGIILASLSREMIPTYHHKIRVFGGFLLGVSSLVFGQMVVERIFHFNTTVSVIVNFIGGIYFIYLMMKEAKR